MKSMRISYAAHRYAPELFTRVRVYNKPFALEHYQLQSLGYTFITKGHEACVAEIKRLYRASLRKRRRCTIGFMLKDHKSEYCFTRDLSAFDDKLSDKLHIYKEFKRFMSEQGGKYAEYQSATLGADYKPEHVETHYQKVDMTRPVKIYFVDPKEAKA